MRADTFNPFEIFRGAFLPNCILRRKELTPSAKLIYGRLLQYAGEKGYCWPSVAKLAEEIGLSERQIQRTTAEIERFGLIRKEVRDGTSNVYVFLRHPWIFGDEPTTPTSPPPTTSTSYPPTTSTSPRRNPLEETQEEDPPVVPPAGGRDDAEKEDRPPSAEDEPLRPWLERECKARGVKTSKLLGNKSNRDAILASDTPEFREQVVKILDGGEGSDPISAILRAAGATSGGGFGQRSSTPMRQSGGFQGSGRRERPQRDSGPPKLNKGEEKARAAARAIEESRKAFLAGEFE